MSATKLCQVRRKDITFGEPLILCIGFSYGTVRIVTWCIEFACFTHCQLQWMVRKQNQSSIFILAWLVGRKHTWSDCDVLGGLRGVKTSTYLWLLALSMNTINTCLIVRGMVFKHLPCYRLNLDNPSYVLVAIINIAESVNILGLSSATFK